MRMEFQLVCDSKAAIAELSVVSAFMMCKNGME